MKLKDIVDDFDIEIYELNRCITSPVMHGAILYKGKATLLRDKEILNRNVFRIFQYKPIGYTVVIVV